MCYQRRQVSSTASTPIQHVAPDLASASALSLTVVFAAQHSCHPMPCLLRCNHSHTGAGTQLTGGIGLAKVAQRPPAGGAARIVVLQHRIAWGKRSEDQQAGRREAGAGGAACSMRFWSNARMLPLPLHKPPPLRTLSTSAVQGIPPSYTLKEAGLPG